MSKKTRKSVSLDSIVSLDSVNVRLADNYDLESLIPQIVAKGGITDPVSVEAGADGVYTTLRGNRRIRAAKAMKAAPAGTYPPEVLAALSKVDCFVYEALTSEERDSLIFDHGETRPLNREETLCAVWRLFKSFAKEKEIGQRMHAALARYTGNEKKLNHLPADPIKREEYLSEWFRGTLGGFMLSAATMGDEVRAAMVMTARKEDGRLKEGETVPFLATRPRIVALSKARTADQKAGGWTVESGGETFNKAIADFKDEDAGRATSGATKKRPTVKDLNDRAAMFKSAPLKAAFAVAAGEDGAGAALLSMDETIHRATIVSEVLAKSVPLVTDDNVRALLVALLGTGPAADVEAALVPFLPKS